MSRVFLYIIAQFARQHSGIASLFGWIADGVWVTDLVTVLPAPSKWQTGRTMGCRGNLWATAIPYFTTVQHISLGEDARVCLKEADQGFFHLLKQVYGNGQLEGDGWISSLSDQPVRLAELGTGLPGPYVN